MRLGRVDVYAPRAWPAALHVLTSTRFRHLLAGGQTLGLKTTWWRWQQLASLNNPVTQSSAWHQQAHQPTPPWGWYLSYVYEATWGWVQMEAGVLGWLGRFLGPLPCAVPRQGPLSLMHNIIGLWALLSPIGLSLPGTRLPSHNRRRIPHPQARLLLKQPRFIQI